ncbi:unnamed protein product [Moneuplotes crassus]|uniref:Uncharacterized protein n=1 Tax=Euplotes crassus TaxID=5936 RepID=A0AAD1UGS5_EUPCR|nr:unnamed protein product [Moneuplotes crassus]
MCNILPYFGYLDQNYKLMSQLCIGSYTCWKYNHKGFCLKACTCKRRELKFCFIYGGSGRVHSAKEVIQLVKKYPILYKIFDLPVLMVTSQKEANCFLKFLKEADLEYLRFTSILFQHIKHEAKFWKSMRSILEVSEQNSEQFGTSLELNDSVDLLDKRDFRNKSLFNNSDLDQIDPKLKSHVTSLIINKFEKDLYDTNVILRGVKLLVDWFDNIKNLKLNFTYTDPCRDNYILLNFHDRVTESIEVNITKKLATREVIEAKDCYFRSCFYNHTTGYNDRRFFVARKVLIKSPINILNKNRKENWQPLIECSVLRLEGIRETDALEDHICAQRYCGFYSNDYLGLSKTDITKISSSSILTKDVLRQFPKANFTLILSNSNKRSKRVDRCCTMDNVIIDDYKNTTNLGLVSLSAESSFFKPVLTKFMKKNLISLELALSNKETAQELIIFQTLCQMIKKNNSLQEIKISVHDDTSVVSILDSCESKPSLGSIRIACSQNISKQVKAYVKAYKRNNSFKSVQIFVPPAEKKGYCAIF